MAIRKYCDYCGQLVPEGTPKRLTLIGDKDLCDKHTEEYMQVERDSQAATKGRIDAWWEGRKK